MSDVKLDGPRGRGGPAAPLRVEVDVRHQDILRVEADALGCRLTSRLEPDDEASRRLFAAAGDTLRADIRWALAGRGRSELEPGEALTIPVRPEYPVGRVGFLMLAGAPGGRTLEEAEAILLAAFLNEALVWGFESIALPVSGSGAGVSLAVAARLLGRMTSEKRPLPKRVRFLARGEALLPSPRRGVE